MEGSPEYSCVPIHSLTHASCTGGQGTKSPLILRGPLTACHLFLPGSGQLWFWQSLKGKEDGKCRPELPNEDFNAE